MRDSGSPPLGPALIVVAVALVVVVGGIGLSFAFGGSGPSGTTGASGTTGTSITAGLAAASASRDIAVIASDGQPPDDVSSSLVVPAGATLSSHQDIDGGLSTFNRSVSVSVVASPSAVVAFYRAQMPRHGWGLLPDGVTTVSGGGTELFYNRAGSDGYYWQVAVIVTSQSPSITPALGGGDQTAPTSLVELDLVQAGDAD